jgi:hypothetical protein
MTCYSSTCSCISSGKTNYLWLSTHSRITLLGHILEQRLMKWEQEARYIGDIVQKSKVPGKLNLLLSHM